MMVGSVTHGAVVIPKDHRRRTLPVRKQAVGGAVWADGPDQATQRDPGQPERSRPRVVVGLQVSWRDAPHRSPLTPQTPGHVPRRALAGHRGDGVAGAQAKRAAARERFPADGVRGVAPEKA